MTTTCWELPQEYALRDTIDLEKNKKQAWLVNGLAIVIMVVLLALGAAIVNPWLWIDRMAQSGALLPCCLCLVVAMVGYIILHEFVHGIFIKRFSGKRARYAFKGLYASAGSDAYFDKRSYIIIALAPVVVFGVLFFLGVAFLPYELFWLVWLLQATNLAGAAGDVYVTWYMLAKAPAEVLVRDYGARMEVFAPAAQEKPEPD